MAMKSKTSKYSKENNYLWKPSKMWRYIIEVYIKDKPFDGDFMKLRKKMNFTIEE